MKTKWKLFIEKSGKKNLSVFAETTDEDSEDVVLITLAPNKENIAKAIEMRDVLDDWIKQN